jgi:hypothetical protein
LQIEGLFDLTLDAAVLFFSDWSVRLGLVFGGIEINKFGRALDLLGGSSLVSSRRSNTDALLDFTCATICSFFDPFTRNFASSANISSYSLSTEGACMTFDTATVLPLTEWCDLLEFVALLSTSTDFGDINAIDAGTSSILLFDNRCTFS